MKLCEIGLFFQIQTKGALVAIEVQMPGTHIFGARGAGIAKNIS